MKTRWIFFALLVFVPPISAGLNEAQNAYSSGNFQTALKELLPLANNGDTIARTILGLMYAKGQGVTKNMKKAEILWKESAEKGDAKAAYFLGVMYLKGTGIPVDEKEGTKWLNMAAERGFPKAIEELNSMKNTNAQANTQNIGETKINTDNSPEAVSPERKANAEGMVMQARMFGDLGQFKDCKDILKKAVKENPANPEAFFLLGGVKLEQGNHAESIVDLNEAIRLKPDYAEAWNHLGMAHERLKKYSEAEKAFTKAVHLQPKSPKFRLNLGTTLGILGKKEQAETELKEALKLAPEDTKVLNNLGLLLVDLGRQQEATELFNKGLSIEPDSPTLLQNSAKLAFDSGNFSAADGFLKRLLIISPDDASFRCLLGKTLMKNGDPTGAANQCQILFDLGNREEGEELLSQLPSSHSTMRSASEPIRDPFIKPEKIASSTILEEAASKNIDDTNLQYQLGLAYIKEGYFQEAEKIFRKTISAFPVSAEARLVMGEIFLHLAKEVAVPMTNAKSSNFNGDNSKTKAAILQQEHLTNAEKSVCMSLRFNPKSLEARLMLAKILATGKRFEEATREFETLFAINADFPEAHGEMGIMLFQQEKYKEAIVHLKKKAAAFPEEPMTAFMIGIAHKELGEFEAARKQQTILAGIKSKRAESLTKSLARSITEKEQELQCKDDPKYLVTQAQRTLSSEEAIKLCRKAISMNPKCEEAYITIIRNYLTMQDNENAMNTCNEAIKALPDSNAIHMERGFVFLRGGNRKVAEEEITYLKERNAEMCAALQEAFNQE
ncbi:MAG: tetratricopeptide repeat protein [Candidatus Riflebacteria bacterium]|nr:tetratricopeptide repeat protein [Candidatus Riflebacteria bacterium]